MDFIGQILEIDLSAGTWKSRPFPEELVWQYLGGRGFNVQFLYHNLSPDTDPLGPENILLFSCGLLTGTAAPTSARLHINARSPLTGLLGGSNVGGGFGAQLRACGIQSMIIRGRSPEPVYIWISGDTVEIRNAKSLWGLST
jgi:aldehyde:ferredoxin oxidoreductase